MKFIPLPLQLMLLLCDDDNTPLNHNNNTYSFLLILYGCYVEEDILSTHQLSEHQIKSQASLKYSWSKKKEIRKISLMENHQRNVGN
jgi:hypothetical protein